MCMTTSNALTSTNADAVLSRGTGCTSSILVARSPLTCTDAHHAPANTRHVHTTAHDVEAQALLDLSEIRWARVAELARADVPTRALLDAAEAAGDDHAQACEAFRRKHYPHSGRIVATSGTVYAVSPAGRRSRLVFTEGGTR